MSQDKAFTMEVRDDGVAVVTIDVPGESMNTLKDSFAEEVGSLMNRLESDDSVKGVVFISGKPGSFIAGADINMIDGCENAVDAESLARKGQAMFDRIEQLNVPVVAAINGACLGGGLELAMACHVRICTDNSKTALGLPEVKLGLLPGSGGTQRLPELVGVQQGLTMILTGKELRAKQAKKAGLVAEVVPQSILLDVAVEHALKRKPKSTKPPLKGMSKVLEATRFGRDIIFKKAGEQAQKKAHGNYPAIDKIIQTVREGVERGREAGLDKEARSFGELAMTPESYQLRQIFFATTEMKKETGADGVEPDPVKRVGVLGGGLMGGGIAYVTAAKAGIPARIKDISEDGISNALHYSYERLNKKVKRRHMRRAELEKTMLMLSGSLDYSGFERTDVVIEAVFEDLNLKQKMVADVEEHAAESTIFATNTSSLPITQIAATAKRPEQVIGLHYFSPVDKMPLAEIITHSGTSDKTIATTVSLAKKQGKTPIVVKDGAGFYVNRILAPYMNEAARLLLAGEPIEHLDKTLVKFGFPVGPITLLDEVGIDVAAKVAPVLVKELGDRFEAPDAFEKLIDDDRKGKKNQKGFYQYGKGVKGKPVDTSVYSLLDIDPKQSKSADEIIDICLLPMLNEAAYCLQEEIIRSPRDGDIGAIFGIGFPPFLGGPFRYMDSQGLETIVNKLEKLASERGERYTPAPLLKQMVENGWSFYQ
ncbi:MULTISPECIES: fatty acid oxidation complex subunit alpha FadJ [Idiomarina]|jgi:3-hydroxyacyl-CoA dehydrogenase/enoyl-CoA hydratase/3-hydroxybutyryl-CoA epimerase|uniref:fatty acid oxidation complex subunit alpha FadJ n=1 Tax=Idiomarina TaxID=135575 RepID=UPI0006C8D0DE|nr:MULTISPECIES: fatty acid oxidation complex subunit alpha FadJ [Idiomarina]KPD22267.1 multifunctional fatty acid oxidation complex subunit alpha [Idiomarina abyssalis]MBH94587.1 fatty acid oxidation complex subunit alpha FadJ [Idiomarina sp.]QZN91720.1 fatty acid oxidation complex subunit alpha FadJ [Idiomarina abyssalis]SFT37560.1 short chain enoyl-CoA hydratase /3-hydroxyacyl-CoA dehydrogenase [Idiomarina abyssalis]|tara:strand:+ start:15475 stop:17601 length:2127 start_codon:yes stop_codon:yes gene_type:complete